MARRRTSRRSPDPELAAVQGFISEARRATRLRELQAGAARTGLRAALAERGGQLEGAFGDVEAAGREASSRATSALAGLGPHADPYRAIIAGEQSSGLRRAAEARSRGRDEVGKIGTSIEREHASRVTQAGQDFQETMRQIAGRVSEAGTERAKQEAQNALARARIRATRRGQTLSHRDRLAKLNTDAEKDDYQRKNKLGPYKPVSAKAGGGPAKYAGFSRSDYLRGRDILFSKGKPAKTLGTRALRRDAITYLSDKRGIDPVLARRLVRRYDPTRRPKKRTTFVGSPNAILNSG